MNDRGEKIVTLAKEMLQAEFPAINPETKPSNLAAQVKAVCLAALVAAFGSQLVTHTIDEARRPLNRYEKVELEALIFYASRTRQMDGDGLRRGLLLEIKRNSVDDMTRADFDPARDYLQEHLK